MELNKYELFKSNWNTITNNTGAIHLYDSSNNKIMNNIANSNGFDGIYLKASSSNWVSSNIANSNSNCGIALIDDSSNNVILKNTANSNNIGIKLWESSSNLLDTTVNSNRIGFYLYASNSNLIEGNTVSSNRKEGVKLCGNDNTILNNNLCNNEYGIEVWCGPGNNIYLNNFIDNTYNAKSSSSSIWNSVEEKTYIYNEAIYKNYMGNYWNDYDGNDTDGDGIGNTPYSIDSAKDNYPLMKTWENYRILQPPIASFTYSPKNPVVNETVTFDAYSSYDIDGYITFYEWTFGDGNTKSGSYEDRVTHSYTSVGDYMVTLTVTDNDGAKNSTNKKVIVKAESEYRVHNLNTGKNFSSIQAAIDDSDTKEGDAITVDPGTYTENVDVYYRSLTVKSTSGNPADTIVQAANPNDHVFSITADYVNISGFTIKDASNCYGIYLNNVNQCNISNNIISNNYRGIDLNHSSRNNITKNICTLNTHSGIAAWWGSNYNNIRDSTKHGSGYYRGINLDEGSSYNTIKGNNVIGNEYGICFWTASDPIRSNIIIYNNISNNNYGIRFHSGNIHDAIFYLNNFIDNTNNVYSSGSGDTWNSTSKITYGYNGSQYTNYMGNYWDDYTDIDADSDGIWDNPRSIDSNWDYHPLVEPWENYFAPTENIFDTGAPSNPYPSIAGTHNGTITPSCIIAVSKLYTYPCSGTGGHTEYARIWNNSGLDVNASWNGYVDDWHNISFSEPFTLLPNETYNYTIRTGSYPQIYHTPEQLPTANGWINCSEFVDANGRIYKDWIPAIKLWRE